MATNAGVWIDHRKAVLVRMTDHGEEIREISSKVDKAYQPPTGPASKQPGRPSGFVAEDVHCPSYSGRSHGRIHQGVTGSTD